MRTFALCLVLAGCARAPALPQVSPAPPARLQAVVEAGFVIPERPLVPPEVTATIEEVTYAVEGATAEAINASMQERSPFRDADGNRTSDGYTRWSLRWDFRPVPTEDGCRLTDTSVALSLTTTTFRWTPAPEASPETARAVRDAEARLLAHEREHQTLSVLAALEVADLLRGAPASNLPCDRLRQWVNARGLLILDHLRAVNREFDVVTRSGTVPPPGAR